MNIENDIWTLEDDKISQVFESRADFKKPTEGLVEQVIREDINDKEVTLVLYGDEIIYVDTFPFIIGKSKMANFTIQGNTYVSRKHCRITKRGAIFYLEDLNSTNGTFINGEPLQGKIELREGMRVRLADKEYVVRWQS